MFAGLLISATSAQKHLRLGFEHRDISHVCWAARTLLELFVWADFCRADKENARRFYQDAMRDLNGTMVTFQQLLDVIDVTPEQRMMIDDTQEGSEDLSVRGGLAPQNTKFTQVADAADKIGRGPWFRQGEQDSVKTGAPDRFRRRDGPDRWTVRGSLRAPIHDRPLLCPLRVRFDKFVCEAARHPGIAYCVMSPVAPIFAST